METIQEQINRNKELMGLIVEQSTTCYDEGHHMACTDSVCSPGHSEFNSVNPFCEAGYGSYWQEEGPEWENAAKLWTNWSGVHSDTTSYPLAQNFVDTMSTLGCGGKQKRWEILRAKESNLMPGGKGPEPGNPMWQSKVMSKDIWFINEFNTNC